MLVQFVVVTLEYVTHTKHNECYIIINIEPIVEKLLYSFVVQVVSH